MHGWVPILIMIGLGAGFGAFNIVLSHLVGTEETRRPKSWRRTSAACRPSATPANAIP